jgi:hypothetical protein
VLSLAGVAYARTIQVIVLVGVASLGGWGGIAGRRAGLAGWGVVMSTGCGRLLGCVIHIQQALLQPGQQPFRQ